MSCTTGCGTSSHLTTPIGTTMFCAVPVGCVNGGSVAGTVGLYHLAKGQDLETLLNQIPDGATFRLTTHFWPDGCCIVAIKNGTTYTIIGGATEGIFPLGAPVLVATGTSPDGDSGTVDPLQLEIAPICGTKKFRLEFVPAAAVGSVKINGANVWVKNVADSDSVFVDIDAGDGTFDFAITLTEGSIDIFYHSDIV